MLASLLLAGLLATSDPLSATAIGVSPIGVDQPAGARAAVINLSNRGARPVTLQVRLFLWTQADGEETLTRTDAVVASPPVTTVQPGQTNIVRLVRADPAPPPFEAAYRLIVDEIPSPSDPADDAVKLSVRYSLPAFFQPPRPGAADLSWRLEPDGDHARLRVENRGGRHAQLSRLTLSGPRGVVWRNDGLLGYVLAGAAMSWPLPPEALAGDRLAVRTEDGEIAVDLTADR